MVISNYLDTNNSWYGTSSGEATVSISWKVEKVGFRTLSLRHLIHLSFPPPRTPRVVRRALTTDHATDQRAALRLAVDRLVASLKEVGRMHQNLPPTPMTTLQTHLHD